MIARASIVDSGAIAALDFCTSFVALVTADLSYILVRVQCRRHSRSVTRTATRRRGARDLHRACVPQLALMH